jgi:hypothetical protein
MKYQIKRTSLLIPIGLFVIAGSFILSLLVFMTDLAKGFLMGVGLGLMILAFIRKSKNR